MVVAGLMSIVGLAITSVVTNSTKSQKKIEQKDSQQGMASYIRGVLQNAGYCINAFCQTDVATCAAANLTLLPRATATATQAEKEIYALQMLGSTGTAQPILRCDETQSCNTLAATAAAPVAVPFGSPLPGSPGMFVYGMRLMNIVFQGEVPAGVHNSSATLVIKYAIDTKMSSGGQLRETALPLIIRANAAGTITGCTAGAVDSKWQDSPTVAGAIFYPGLVGIKTTAPDADLTVFGSDNAQAVINLKSFSGAAALDSPNVVLFRSRGTAVTPAFPANNDRMGGFSATNGVGAPAAWAGLSVFATEDHSASARGMDLRFYTVPNSTPASSGAERLRINAAGDVGIGTINPLARLQVDGTATAGIRVENTTNPIFHMRRDAANEWFMVASPAGANRLDLRPGALGNAPVMTMLTSGRVGIGTTTPEQALEINNGAVRLNAGIPASDAAAVGLAFEDNGDTGLFMNNYTNNATGDLNLFVNSVSKLTVTGVDRKSVV